MALDRAAERARNRAAFPVASNVVDDFRAVFGAGVHLLWACEGGVEIGKRTPDGVPVVVGESMDAILARIGVRA
jgi:hypothetical protein